MKAGMIERGHIRTTYYHSGAVALTDLHEWVFSVYGFLVAHNEALTVREFGERIKRYYSLGNGHNRAAYEAMVQLAEVEGV